MVNKKTTSFIQTFGILFGINLVEYLLISFGISIFENKLIGLLIVNFISVLLLKQFGLIKE